MNIKSIILLSALIGLLCSFQGGQDAPYVKDRTIYFDIETIGKDIPYNGRSVAPYELNDSVVCDLKYKKLRRRLSLISYKKKDYYSKDYAPPIALMEFKVSKVRIDTVLTEDRYEQQPIYSIRKHYSTKLLNKVDYFKYRSK